MAKIIPVSLLSLFIVMNISAQQGEVRMTASIAGAVPIGQFKDMVDKTSFRGVDIYQVDCQILPYLHPDHGIQIL